ncbi:FkbM family methyltransferase [Sinorhizobium meliloti]|nr:FkbM family methyltransferase [Sinorhizobium meliloti]MDW9620382.1 FkbM family methyltransferase [Sinorhizobium meliloti]MDX0178067.1 FkbM family methyltransferase [Sinorhizobium meliloti]
MVPEIQGGTMIFEKEDLTEEKLKAYSRRGVYVIPDKMTPDYLSRFGFKPDVVIDVGVSNGSDFLYSLFPATKTVLVDPLPDFEAKIKTKFGNKYDFDFYHCAAGREPGHATLRIQSDNASKSTLANPTRMQGQNTGSEVTVDVRTLDSISEKYSGAIGLKIDTEGFEMEVLGGAVETLKRTEFVLAEVSIKERYIGGYRFSDVVLFMRDNGFEIIDMLNPVWRVHMFWDCLFVKKDSPLFASRAI